MSMNVFEPLYSFIHAPIKWIKWKCRNIKWTYQRATKGYCDTDVWNLDSSVGAIFEGALRQLSENHCGYPHNYPGGEEKWTKDLAHCADLFHIINADIYDEDRENWKEFTEKQETAKHEAFEFLEKNWYSLWD